MIFLISRLFELVHVLPHSQLCEIADSFYRLVFPRSRQAYSIAVPRLSVIWVDYDVSLFNTWVDDHVSLFNIWVEFQISIQRPCRWAT